MPHMPSSSFWDIMIGETFRSITFEFAVHWVNVDKNWPTVHFIFWLSEILIAVLVLRIKQRYGRTTGQETGKMLEVPSAENQRHALLWRPLVRRLSGRERARHEGLADS
jgi:hypothetical protein